MSLKKIEKKKEIERLAKEIFQSIDVDSSDYLDESEINQLLKMVSNSDAAISKEHVKDVFKALDTDGDGKISFEEFKVYIIKMIDNTEEEEEE